jgi:hypothetical protein
MRSIARRLVISMVLLLGAAGLVRAGEEKGGKEEFSDLPPAPVRFFSVLLQTDTLDLPSRKKSFMGVGLEVRPDWSQPYSGYTGTLAKFGVYNVLIGFTESISLRISGSVVDTLDLDPVASQPQPGFSLDADPVDSGTPRVATLIRILKERGGRPAIGASFAATLPTTDNEEGIGLDTTDVYAGALCEWQRRDWEVALAMGVGILTSATTLTEQNDVLTLGVRGARRLPGRGLVLGEANGRLQTRSKGLLGLEDRGVLRVGYGRQTGRRGWEVMLVQGLTGIDGDLGAAFAYKWAHWQRDQADTSPP